MTSVIRTFRGVLGDDGVWTDDASLRSAETATFATTQRVAAVLRPRSRDEVAQCMRIASEHHVELHPTSRGRNWGYGSRVPVRTGAMLLDLSRMDRIVAYDAELGYLTVEPGVTFRAAAAHLRDHGGAHMLNVIGGSPDASVLANTVDRGLGNGPLNDRFLHSCAFEVVLATGEILEGGFSRFTGAGAAHVHRWGVGPFLDGLFTQSNLGVVTRITTWLSPRPKCFDLVVSDVRSDADAVSLALALRGTLADARTVVQITKPRLPKGTKAPATTAWGPLPRRLPGAPWIAFVGLYADDPDELRARRRALLRVSAPHVVGSLAVGETMTRLVRPAQHVLARMGLELRPLLHIRDTFWLGQPDDMGIASTYATAGKVVPAGPLDLDRDRVGVLWLAPVVPARRADLDQALTLARETYTEHGFSPYANLRVISPRAVEIVTNVVYDRDVAGEDERAMKCFRDLERRFVDAGLLPYRLGIQSMDSLPRSHDDHRAVLARLKAAVDPENILAPGRYES